MLSADDGGGALQALRQQPVDVILLDVMMPGMDGLQVCERLRESEALRAHPGHPADRQGRHRDAPRGMTLGVSEYLTKPVNKLELFARLQAQLHSRELNHKLAETAAAASKLK